MYIISWILSSTQQLHWIWTGVCLHEWIRTFTADTSYIRRATVCYKQRGVAAGQKWHLVSLADYIIKESHCILWSLVDTTRIQRDWAWAEKWCIHYISSCTQRSWTKYRRIKVMPGKVGIYTIDVLMLYLIKWTHARTHMHTHTHAHPPIPQHTHTHTPLGANWSCLQTTWASSSSQWWSQMVPKVLLMQISTLPELKSSGVAEVPFTSLTSPRLQPAGAK